MLGRAFMRRKQSRRFDDVVDTEIAPAEIRGVTLTEALRTVGITDKVAVLRPNDMVKSTMHRVVGHEIRKIVRGYEIVDRDDFESAATDRFSIHQSPNSSKPIDTDSNRHASCP